jgi:hypothetical protein
MSDDTIRETYPPLPRSGGNTNKEMTESAAGMVASKHAATVQHEAEFRAKQYARRLQTRGLAAMSPLTPEELALPDDPALDEYKQAGWLV